MNRLKDKVAIITGGVGNIGKETAQLFLQEGAKVAIVDLSNEALTSTVDELKTYGDIISITADVTQEKEVKDYVQTVLDKWGKIDVFFNNAGIEGDVNGITDFDLNAFKKVIDVNLIGSFLGLKHVLPVMQEQQFGSIINTSSDAGWSGDGGLSAYVASKHGVVGLTKTAALEAADDKVRVNSIQPTGVDTRMMNELEKEYVTKGVSTSITDEAIPFGRYAKTIELAYLILFLASDESQFITGSQYTIDGGRSALSR
ncbi:SDR family NAD(P)-dependent oxidoreductase [Lentibacillus amyloliquefaciens]|uniref:Oxidoreductase n=1 Tax=Lentibacillus amyloliquefaciens TaxID=1472767 RepID=A0A0U4FB80_9BACI|nr:SDR family oxidoreductase [Lentibacillus amyloliquefaciens]ALX47757.1 oxidoreductase [Lentibacillus amyloliquefaciens]